MPLPGLPIDKKVRFTPWRVKHTLRPILQQNSRLLDNRRVTKASALESSVRLPRLCACTMRDQHLPLSGNATEVILRNRTAHTSIMNFGLSRHDLSRFCIIDAIRWTSAEQYGMRRIK